jgi:predicted nucleic acid-binding Zn ribbon protein
VARKPSERRQDPQEQADQPVQAGLPDVAGRPQPAGTLPAEPAHGAGAEEDLDAAKAVLNRVRLAAAARGDVRTRASSRRRQSRGNRPAAAPQDFGRDPQGLGRVFDRFVAERGWNSPVAVGSVISRWDELVGPDIAAHCRPESFEDTTVQVRCDSTAWATQLRLLNSDLLKRFADKLGPGVVTKIQVLAPAAPNWRKGKRTVSGRGPRDTYG